MKFLIFFAGLLALGLAADFKVKSGNETCTMVTVSGSFDYTAQVDGKEILVSLDLDKAEFLEKNSSCSRLKLLFTDNDAQVWFDFKEDSGDKQIISLVSAFMPSNLFSNSSNETVVFTADSAFQSPKNQSYKCVSEVSTPLVSEDFKDVNVTAVLKDFQAQSSDIKEDKFSEATECTQDGTTPSPTPTPTTASSTTPTASTTPAPPDNSYPVTSGNVTCINMTGILAFTITYETKEKGKTNTAVIYIPANHNIDGSCKYENSSDMQSLEVMFFDKTWAIAMVFSQKDDNYHISQINMTYVFDDNLPDALLSGQTEMVSLNTKTDYLKSKVDGYYLCTNNVTLALNSNVTFSTKNFKYQAFNKKSTAEFDSDSVAECSQDEDSNSIVPIAVGAALAGLVVIVLIAYLIGRRRSKKSGYESV